MQPYQNLGGNSGVRAYEIGEGSIIVEFERGGAYLYTDASSGATHIAEMQRLARSGEGLATYINKHTHDTYEREL